MSADRFPHTGWLHRGYARRQVDDFLRAAEAALADDARRSGVRLPAALVRSAGFDLVRRGYDVAAVDAALDDLEQRAVLAEAPAAARPAPLADADALDAATGALRETLTRVAGDRAPYASRLARGYRPEAVDRFLDTVVAMLDGAQEPDVAAVRGVVFPPRRGGYDEDAVDELLDRVVDVLLRRSVAPPGGSSAHAAT